MSTSTKENPEFEIIVFPNPAKDHINIHVEGTFHFLSTLYDLNGRIIDARYNNGSLLNIDSIQAGIYLLEIIDINSGKRQVNRVVVTN